MRLRVLYKFFANFLFVLLPLLGFSQWEMASGLDGGTITQIARADTFLFIATKYNGIYSNVNGSIWEKTYEYENFRKVTTAGNCVFIYDDFSNNACLRSFDYGASWENVQSLYNESEIWSIDTVVYVLSDNVFWKSIDYGNTFDSIQLPLENWYAEIFCDDSILYAYFWNQYFEQRIFYSSNYGGHWDSLSTVGLFPYTQQTIRYLGFLNGSFWAVTETISAPSSLKSIFIYDQSLGVWNLAINNLPIDRSFKDIIEYNNKILCCYESYPVMEFNYQDSTWFELTNGSKGVNQFLVHNDKLYCATDQGPCILDTNWSWITQFSGLTFRNISSIDYLNGTIYLTANNELYYSDDGGASFNRNDNAYGHQIITTDSVFYLISERDFWISRDHGNMWESFVDGIEYILIQQFNHFSITSKYYYLGTNRGLYKSPAYPIYWTELDNGPFGSYLNTENVEAVDNTIIAGEQWPAYSLYFSLNYGYSFSEFGEYCEFRKIDHTYYLLKDSILYSEDEAHTWEYIPNDNVDYRYGIDRVEDTIVLGGRDIYGNPMIEITYDMGNTWIDIIDNLPEVFTPYQEFYENLKVVKMINGRVFVSNPRYGLWYRDDLIVGVKEGSVFANAGMSEIYPNPAHHYVNIRYLILNTRSSILIYDCIGHQMEEVSTPAGQKEIRLNVSQYANGIYIAVLKDNSGGFVKQKFVVAR